MTTAAAAPVYLVRRVPFTTLEAAADHALTTYAIPPAIAMMVPTEDGEGKVLGAYYTYDAGHGYGAVAQDYT